MAFLLPSGEFFKRLVSFVFVNNVGGWKSAFAPLYSPNYRFDGRSRRYRQSTCLLLSREMFCIYNTRLHSSLV